MLDPLKDLLSDNKNDCNNKQKKCSCPRTNVKIMDVNVNALIDSGSEITCISSKFYDDNIKSFENCPKLPVIGTTVKGAIFMKSKRVKLQLFCPIQINDLISKILPFLVVPDLNEDCILGIDMLVELRAIITTHEQNIKFLNYENEIVTECSTHSLRICDNDIVDNISVKKLNNSNDELTDFEIDNKLKSCHGINNEQKSKLRNLICEFKQVFRKKPGLLNSYEHVLKLKDETPFRTNPYPIPLKYRELVNCEIDKMLELGIIRR